MTIKVAVLGSKGKMGSEVIKAVKATSDLELVASIDQDDDFNIIKNFILPKEPLFQLQEILATKKLYKKLLQV